MDPAEVRLALSTFPDEATARQIVRQLVEAKLVACGSIIPRVESIYRWQGKVESRREILTLFKLASANYSLFEERLRALHPYDVPEIICVKIDGGWPDYLRWVAESCLSEHSGDQPEK